jgi:glutathione S-transferase
VGQSANRVAHDVRIGYLERELADKEYIAADRFTAADISCGYTLGIAKFVTDADLPPTCAAYLKRLQARRAAIAAAAVK